MTSFLSCIAQLDEMASNPHDDYCPAGKIILCPPGAAKNEDWKCVDKDLAKDLGRFLHICGIGSQVHESLVSLDNSVE